MLPSRYLITEPKKRELDYYALRWWEGDGGAVGNVWCIIAKL